MQNFSAASPLRGSGADRSDTASLVSEMPSALKKRFLGLAAVAGVIFLINFPSPTAVAAVCAILITGVVLTWSDSSISNSSKTSSEEFRRQKLEKALQNFRQNGFSAQTADLKVNGQDPLADVKTNGTAKTTSQKMDGDLKIDGVPIPKTRENGKEINGQVQDSRQNGSQMSDLRSNGAVEDSGVPAEALGLKANGAQKSVGHGVETKLDKAQNPVSGMSSQLTSGTDNPALDAKINTQATGLGASQGNGHAKAPAVIPSKNQHKAANGTGEQTQKVVIPEQPVAVHKVEPSARKAPALAGGAAVLARLRQQRAQVKAPKAASPIVIFAYASQTGTAQEIAKGLQADSESHNIQSKVLSLNEVGFENLVKMESPIIVIVAASTGDGDSPDNAAKFYGTLKRRTQEPGQLKNVKFTTLGLGDSNYTRFMGVSRALRTRMQELGAQIFYPHAEADEVDGLESTIDPWTDGLWPSLKEALKSSSTDVQEKLPSPSKLETNGSVGGAKDKPEGVPALPACRIEVRWSDNTTESSGEKSSEITSRDPEGLYSAAQPFYAPVIAARYLTSASSDRKVLHLEIGLKGSGIGYQPGDSIGIMPENEDSLVDGVITRLGLKSESVFEVKAKVGSQNDLLSHLGCPCTVRHAFKSGCDLTSAPRKSLLRLLAEHCSVTAEKDRLLLLSSRSGREEYKALVEQFPPSLLDLLQLFPSCKPPLAELLDALPQLMPRLYSISSSPLEFPDAAHVAMSVVCLGSPLPNVGKGHQNGNGKHVTTQASPGRWGVATGWLERLVEPIVSGNIQSNVLLPIHLKRGGNFGVPADLSHPMLMIGPGTGVAPFRGFLQHRRALMKDTIASSGEAFLYFGCRRQDEDYLYGAEFEDFEKQKVLTKLDVAFSRKTAAKIYVQHRILEQANEVGRLLRHPELHIFVCGDGAHMAKDVHTALLQVLEQQLDLSSTAAAAHLVDMTKSGRYIRDIWS